NGDQLTELARRIDTERLRPIVGNVGALSDGPRLWAKKVAGGIPGKVVLTPSSPAVGCTDRLRDGRGPPVQGASLTGPQERRNRHQPARCTGLDAGQLPTHKVPLGRDRERRAPG